MVSHKRVQKVFLVKCNSLLSCPNKHMVLFVVVVKLPVSSFQTASRTNFAHLDFASFYRFLQSAFYHFLQSAEDTKGIFFQAAEASPWNPHG